MKISHIACCAVLLAAAAMPAQAHEGVRHDGVFFSEPADGASVPAGFRVVMQIEGMDVQPAGEAVDGAGHHHLIIDGDCVAKGESVPKDATHMHFGKGQTETTLNLEPGKHTLTLQFADGLHRSYGDDWCHTIHVNVE